MTVWFNIVLKYSLYPEWKGFEILCSITWEENILVFTIQSGCLSLVNFSIWQHVYLLKCSLSQMNQYINRYKNKSTHRFKYIYTMFFYMCLWFLGFRTAQHNVPWENKVILSRTGTDSSQSNSPHLKSLGHMEPCGYGRAFLEMSPPGFSESADPF